MTEVLKLSTISQMKKEQPHRPSTTAEFRLDIEPKLCKSIVSAAKEKARVKEVEHLRKNRSKTVTGRRFALQKGIERTLQFQLAALDLREPELFTSKTEGFSPKLRPFETTDKSPGLSVTYTSYESSEANQIVKDWQKKLRSCVTPNTPRSPASASACLSDQEICRGLRVCFGAGFSRSLRPGEKAVLISHIKEFSRENWQASHQTGLNQSLLLMLLKRCRMQYLVKYPACVKQIYSLWKTEHVKEHVNLVQSFKEDPILLKLEEADDLTRKQFVPLSGLYRKHLKYI
mmetsp:Transcript_7747/g.14704  ORF Transcript_7747/g.14704 Transcript_7747/m.14704 type:complete len:288 (-) Transcript_7747:7392-8255(-)